MEISVLLQNVTLMLGIIGVLAFAVSIIVEVSKEIPYINKIATKLYTIIVSVVVCVLSLCMYAAYASIPLYWYYVVLVLFGSLVVALISINGWEAVYELWDRYKYKDKE